MCVSNNAAERALRGIALGAGHGCSADPIAVVERAAAMYSLIVTAKMNDIDPQAGLADVLPGIATLPGPSAGRTAAVELDVMTRPPWSWPVNKVHHVRTITRVAKMLGEDEDSLWTSPIEMDQEDGLIWVYGPGDDGILAFTEDGIETLTDLIQIHKDDPSILTEQQRLSTPSGSRPANDEPPQEYKPKHFTRGLRRMATDFLTRVREDCAASDTWACVLLDNLGRPKPDSASGAGWAQPSRHLPGKRRA